MAWLILSGLSACFEAFKDFTGKQTLNTLNEYTVLLMVMVVGAVALFPVLLLTTGWPTLGPEFGWALLIGGSLNILAQSLYFRAIKLADLSLTVPLVTLTPVFLLVTSPLIVQEWPTAIDVVGVLLLVIGSYVLNFTAQGKSFWTPLMAIVQNKGSRLMLFVAFLWSITSNFDKVGILNSSPLFWAIALQLAIAAGMVPLVLSQRRQLPQMVTAFPKLGMTGLFNATGIGLQFWALTLAPVAQVIAVKRMSTLIAVLLGHFFLGEKGLGARLLGAAIMVAGVAIMAWG